MVLVRMTHRERFSNTELAVPAVDPLEWWRSQTETHKRLSHLARAVLAIPATSAPSERIFFSR